MKPNKTFQLAVLGSRSIRDLALVFDRIEQFLFDRNLDKRRVVVMTGLNRGVESLAHQAAKSNGYQTMTGRNFYQLFKDADAALLIVSKRDDPDRLTRLCRDVPDVEVSVEDAV